MYKVIQLTNQAVGAVEPGALLPLGNITRRYGCRASNGCAPFEVSTSGSNTVTLNEDGYYHIDYVGSLTVGAAGAVLVDLLVNGVEVFSVAETATAADDIVNLKLSYVVRVLPSCCALANSPAIVQLRLDTESVAVTAGTSNIIIEKEK